MEAAPYDNVEFGPLPRKTGTWPGPQGHHQQQQQQSVVMTQQQTSRTLQHGKGMGGGGAGVGVGVTGGAPHLHHPRLAPLEESNAEIADSRDQRLLHASPAVSSSFSSSSTTSSATTHHVQQQRSSSSSGAASSQGVAGTRPANTTGLLTMSAASTSPSTAIVTTTASSTAFKSTTTVSSNNKAAADTKSSAAKENAAPTYVLTQVGSGGTKDVTGLRSSDDDVDFKRHDLDPGSRAVLETAYTDHDAFYKLNSKVLDEGALLKQDVLDIYRKSGETFSYEQLLQGMLEDGEMLLLGGCWLHYVHVEFKDETGQKTIRQPYGKGRLCLTNNRVLLLSADIYTDAILEPYGDVKKKGGYKLEVSKRSSVVSRNLPLTCFHSADLEMNIGTSAQTKITSRSAPCCGLCSCFGIGCCSRRWHSQPPMTRSFNERVVRMGVAMPPWGQRTILVLHLDPGQSLTTARDFVAQLHQHSPNMH